VVEVQVPAVLGLELVVGLEEGDLREQDLGVDDVGLIDDRTRRRCRRGT
jgi:hypothetical protein